MLYNDSMLKLPEIDYIGDTLMLVSYAGGDVRIPEKVSLWLNVETNKYHITTPISVENDTLGQVKTIMKRDMPKSGVYYFRPTSSNLLDYTSGYTKSYINKLIREAIINYNEHI